MRFTIDIEINSILQTWIDGKSNLPVRSCILTCQRFDRSHRGKVFEHRILWGAYEHFSKLFSFGSHKSHTVIRKRLNRKFLATLKRAYEDVRSFARNKHHLCGSNWVFDQPTIS